MLSLKAYYQATSLVGGFQRNRDDTPIIRAIIAMAHAEGI